LEAETNALAAAMTVSSSSSWPDDEKIQKKDRHIILFYGDIITESMRGTAYGRPCQRCQGLADVAQDVFSTSGDDDAAITHVFQGISGDQTQPVLYRIAQSEAALSTLLMSSISTTIIRISFVILIGTNNLSVGMTPFDTARGIRAVAQSLSEIVAAGMMIGHNDQPRDYGGGVGPKRQQRAHLTLARFAPWRRRTTPRRLSHPLSI
jgi:lysophospholipase L1-like esterase